MDDDTLREVRVQSGLSAMRMGDALDPEMAAQLMETHESMKTSVAELRQRGIPDGQVMGMMVGIAWGVLIGHPTGAEQ